MLACGHGTLRAWGRRRVSYVDAQGAKFLQEFINEMIKAMFIPLAPAAGDLRPLLCPSPWHSADNNLQPLPMMPNLLVNTSQVFTNDPMSMVIKATWTAVANGEGAGQANMRLATGTIGHCQLGDFIVFLLAEVPLLAGGQFFAIGICLLRHFAMLLQHELLRIVPLLPRAADMAALRGCCGRSFPHDPRRLIMDMEDIASGKSSGLGALGRKQAMIDHDAAKVLVWAYGRRAHQAMDTDNRTLVFMNDMAKESGESRNLYFSYSPVINLGAWLPFQVTRP